MSKGLIYLIAIFALWMYFSFSGGSSKEKPTISDFDKAQSGHGGTMVNSPGNTEGGYNMTGILEDENGFFYFKNGKKTYIETKPNQSTGSNPVTV